MNDIKDTKRKVWKKISATSMMRHFILESVKEIEDFQDFMICAIEREKELTAQRIEKGAEKLDAEQREAYFEFYSEDYQKIGGVFEKLALDSFVVMLYSQIESGMGTLCHALRRDKQAQDSVAIALKYTDLNGRAYIDRATSYIEKVIGINLNLKDNPDWGEIIALRTIRNAIIHESGYISTNNFVIKRCIDQGLLELKNGDDKNGVVTGEVIIKSTYTSHILPHVRNFFDSVAKMTKELFPAK